MSDEPQSRGKLVVLAVLLVACGGVLAWVLTRPPPGEVSESIEDKASRLTERIQQAEGEAADAQIDLPAGDGADSPVIDRSGPMSVDG